MERAAVEDAKPAAGRRVALGGLIAGHAVIHWYQQSFFVILPEIARSLSLSPVQIGGITGFRQIAGGVVNLPAGLLSDTFRRYTSFLLAISIAWIGLAYVIVGFAPSYPFVLIGMALVGIGSSLWHPPAMGTLARLWADRRGLALSLHGTGASIGDTAAPIAVGALLVALEWRDVLKLGFLPGLFFAAAIALGLRGIYAQGKERKSPSGSHLRALRGLVGNFRLLTLLLAGGIRAMGQMTIVTFLPIYLREDLGYSSAGVGLYLSLLTFMGMGSQPVLGWLSDRVGRKPVLVPSITLLSILVFLIIWAKPGYQLTLLVAAMGLFFYALGSIVMAFGMDIAGRDAESTTVGLIFGSNLIFGAASPVIAGAIVGATETRMAFVYVAALQLLAALAFALLPARRPATVKAPM
ncbi:MAG: MFS transporter [Chloroflexi bacterium]|nr:MFS transporter [Chloroflexota bacterium]